MKDCDGGMKAGFDGHPYEMRLFRKPGDGNHFLQELALIMDRFGRSWFSNAFRRRWCLGLGGLRGVDFLNIG